MTHSPNILAASGEEIVAEGETLVLARDGDIIARISAKRWGELAGG